MFLKGGHPTLNLDFLPKNFPATKPHFHFEVSETDLMEMEPKVEVIDFEKEPVVATMLQCGELCPQNNANHRGACYLDFGHSGNHKCSVDGHEW